MEDFKDFKVLELASVLAGPSVGQFFAELGASVIKVESLAGGGDVTRSWKLAGEQTDDRSAYFTSVNWGKKSVAVDLSTPAGRLAVHKLASRCDLVIASYKPGDAEKLGVDYVSLAALNPALIYAQITGYGSANPRVGYDAVLQAETGYMFMNGEPGQASLKMPVALIDVLAAHHLKEGILLALLQRARTGRGRLVEVSLVQAAVASLVNQATNWLVAQRLPQKQGSSHPTIAPYGDVFKTHDNQEVILAIGSDRQFSDLCAILDIAGLALEERFRTNRMRVENRLDLNSVLQSRMGQYAAGILMPRLHDAKIPAGVIQSMDKVFAMPEAQSLVVEGAGLRGVRSFVAKGVGGEQALLPPPHFGEHTKELEQDLWMEGWAG